MIVYTKYFISYPVCAYVIIPIIWKKNRFEVIRHISALHKLPSLAPSALASGSQPEEMYKKINHSRRTALTRYTTATSLFFSRNDHSKSNSVIGKPQSIVLSPEDKAVLCEAGVLTNSDEVMLYPSLCLSTGNVSVARSKSQMTKRDNSCLRYIDKAQTQCWGILEKIFGLNISTLPTYFCLLSFINTGTSMSTMHR